MATVPTISDIARLAGVGTATVDRVLNQRPGVNAATFKRVMQVVAEIGTPPQSGRQPPLRLCAASARHAFSEPG